MKKPEPLCADQNDNKHFVFNRALDQEPNAGQDVALFGMGCFWGPEKIFWTTPGVILTMVGYGAGTSPNPTYQEVSTGLTHHNELVRIIYDPAVLSYQKLLQIFWENHDPTQLNRQGNDYGTQYRSGIYTFSDNQHRAAKLSHTQFSNSLKEAGYGEIVTEILPAPKFYMAETYHQQYLAKNPNGYCGVGGLGLRCFAEALK